MIKDYIKFAFITFKKRRMRSLLTIIGIFIGMAAIVSLISLGQGLQAVITEQFEMMGSDKIMVSGGSSIMGMVGDIKLTQDDLDAIKKTRGVDVAGGYIFKIAMVKFKDEVKYTYVSGLPQDESKKVIESMMQTVEFSSGRDLEEEDRNKAVIGIDLSTGKFFDKKVGLRDKILIEGEEFRVVGVMGRIGNPEDDSQIFIPLDVARELFNEPNDLDYIMAQVSQGSDPADIAEDVKKELRETRDVEEGEEDFMVQTTEQFMRAFTSIFAIVQVILIGIAAISLLVGGIGIMNSMYTSVLQRTNEIGIMKAIGAKNKDIALIFLIESGLLGLAGGIVGIAAGIGFSKLVEFGASAAGYTIIKAAFPAYLLFGVLLFSFVVGVVSGTLPALGAAKLKPVEALRYE